MKNYLNSNKGITLIALIITVIIMVILAAISINSIYNMGIVDKAIKGVQDYAQQSVEENRMLGEVEKLIQQGVTGTNPFDEEKGVNKPKTVLGMIPIKYNDTSKKWVVCSTSDNDWYEYSTEETKMKWANVMLSDGKYKAETVQIGQVVQDADLGSMFVWIPRYAYSMKNYKQEYKGTDGNTQNITIVKFLNGTSNQDAEGNRYAKDYNADEQTVGEQTEMIVHPAFNFGGKELTGIWVAKFEASMAETNNNTIANNNDISKTVKVLPNKKSWTYITIGNAFLVSYKMNKENNVYGLSTNTNTHLMKNSEWGAVAYLAASQYGKIPTINSNSSYYTAGGNSAGGYKTVANQSTTGNVYGIYDLNGGAYERVAAYWDNGNSNLSTYGGTEVFPSNKLKSEYTAYWDKYEVSGDDGLAGYNAKTTAGNALVAKAAYDRVQLMKSHKGDAMYETINTFSYYAWYSVASTSGSTNYNAFGRNGWFKANYDSSGNVTANNDTSESYGRSYYDDDYALIGTSVQPFVVRGGGWGGGSDAGVFYTYGTPGSAGSYYSFRPVLGV